MKSKEYFGGLKKEIEESLNRYLPKETEYPPKIHQVMRYIVFSGGGRWRPILCLTVAEKIFGGEKKKIMPAACALELIAKIKAGQVQSLLRLFYFVINIPLLKKKKIAKTDKIDKINRIKI